MFFVKEIKDNLEERSSCITHIRRSRNLACHFVANFGSLKYELQYGLGLDHRKSLTLFDVTVTLAFWLIQELFREQNKIYFWF